MTDINYNHATPELVQRVKDVIDEVTKTHKYSMSRIYGAYNEAFEKNEKPESCISCLRSRVGWLKDWLSGYEKINTSDDTTSVPEGSKVNYTIEGVGVVEFTPSKDDATKGSVKLADGNAVKAGTYAIDADKELAVQPGGKATIKENLI